MNNTLQFPLPLLAYGLSHKERLEAVCNYANFTTGLHRMKLSPSDKERELAGRTLPKPNNIVSHEEILTLTLGCIFCGINSPEITSHAAYRVESYRAADQFIKSWQGAGRTVPWTRIPANMLFEARDGTERTYQRFSALCAVNAAIGSKPFAIITRNRMRAGMLGYSSGSVLFNDEGELTAAGRKLLNSRRDGQRHPITTSQARTYFDNFVKSGLLHRSTPYRGSFTYYSKTTMAEEIAAAVLKKAQRTGQNPKLARIGEQIWLAKQGKSLLSGDALLCGDEPETSPHNTDSPLNTESATQSPPDHHLIATQSPHNAASNASLNAAKNASQNADHKASEKVLEQESEPAKPHYPDGGEPSLELVKMRMENRVYDSSQFAHIWLRTMKNRGWMDKGQPVTNWEPLADEFADGFIKKPRTETVGEATP